MVAATLVMEKTLLIIGNGNHVVLFWSKSRAQNPTFGGMLLYKVLL
jgi:hypothetical protein